MGEARTKLVCNLNLDDFFRHPLFAEGIWRRTNEKTKLGGKTYYTAKQLDGSKIDYLLGTERVELTEKGGEK